MGNENLDHIRDPIDPNEQILSIFTAFASWQGSIADSKQGEHVLQAMQNLNDGNAEYLSANQFIVYDLTM